MKKYKLIKSFTQEEFEKLVEQAISEGWQLQGGVSVSVYGEPGLVRILFFQAMIKEE